MAAPFRGVLLILPQGVRVASRARRVNPSPGKAEKDTSELIAEQSPAFNSEALFVLNPPGAAQLCANLKNKTCSVRCDCCSDTSEGKRFSEAAEKQNASDLLKEKRRRKERSSTLLLDAQLLGRMMPP